MTVRETVWTAVTWPFRQVGGTARNIVGFVRDDVTAERLIPPAIRSSVRFVMLQVPRALGWSEPGQQVTAAVVLSVVAFVTGFVTGGAAWVLIFLWGLAALVGLLRFVPIVDRLWPLSSDPPGVFANIRGRVT